MHVGVAPETCSTKTKLHILSREFGPRRLDRAHNILASEAHSVLQFPASGSSTEKASMA